MLLKSWLAVAALLGGLGVAAGAFGAHGLRSRLEPRDLEIFETAVRYQLIHALAVGLAAVVGAPRAAWLFTVGTIVFSGSLYVLVLTGPRWMGAITPIGGLALIGGWLALGVWALRS